MEKFLENLEEAEKEIKKIDHLLYVSFPLVNDKRLLLNSIIGIRNVIKRCINLILQKEYSYRRIKIYRESEKNFRTFEDKCAIRYEINKQEIKLIKELFKIVDMHFKSPIEFLKDNKVVILSDNMNSCSIPLEKAKQFSNLGKDILSRTKKNFEKNLR